MSIDVARGEAIEREVEIRAPIETVWRLWTEPDQLVRWMGRHAELDVRPGGTFRLSYLDGSVVRGEFVVLEPPNHLVLTWGWEAAGDETPPGSSTVEVRIEPTDTGSRLRLTHRGLAAAAVAGHTIGWDLFLPRLRDAAEAEASA